MRWSVSTHHLSDALARLERTGLEIAAAQISARLLSVEVKLWDLRQTLKYSTDQPRVPAGRPGGGQWTSDGEAGGVQVATEIDKEEEEGIDALRDKPNPRDLLNPEPSLLPQERHLPGSSSLIGGAPSPESSTAPAAPRSSGLTATHGTGTPNEPADTADLVRNAAKRAQELQSDIPPWRSGRVTVAYGVLERDGERLAVVATSERGNYGRDIVLNEGEMFVGGYGHAEQKIVDFAKQMGYRVITIGAGRPICPSCAEAIEGVDAIPATPLKRLKR